MVVTFTGLVVPMLKDRPVVIATVIAGITSVLANGMPNKLGLMVGALLGVTAGMVAESLRKPASVVLNTEESV